MLPKGWLGGVVKAAGSFTYRFFKFQPTQPGARCFGSFMIRPLWTGAGKPIEMASYFQPSAVVLICATSCLGESFVPESNLRFSLREIISFTWVPPMSMTRIFFIEVLSGE